MLNDLWESFLHKFPWLGHRTTCCLIGRIFIPNTVKRLRAICTKNWSPPYNEYNPKKIAQEISNEIQPFIDSVLAERDPPRNSQLKLDYAIFKQKFLVAEKLEDLLIDGVAPDWNDPKIYEEGVKFIVTNMFAYLGLIETVAKRVVDMVSMLLVANGKEFYVNRYGKEKTVGSMQSLEKERVSIDEELRFLEDNGIPSLRKLVDNRLRNAIAHLKFELILEPQNDDFIYFPLLNNEGNVYDRKPAKEIIPNSMQCLLDCIDITESLLTQLDFLKG